MESNAPLPNSSREVSGETEKETENSEIPFGAETVHLLSCGLLHIYKPAVTRVKQQLNELTKKQSILVEQLHNENLQLSSTKNSGDLQQAFYLIKTYQTKLVNMKRDMRAIHDKCTKLKKRALRLQQHKDKMEYLRIQRLQQEQDLIGKPS